MTDPASVIPTGPVWRVGRAPHPWAWPDVEYAYGQRWDDIGRDFRTVYAGDSPTACYLEVLAHARPGLTGDPDYDLIDIDETDLDYPTPTPGTVDPGWLAARVLASAILTGTYCDITRTATLQALRPALLRTAIENGFPDFDAAAVKTTGTAGRRLTQTTATYLYNQAAGGTAAYDGVRFTSRHGEEHGLWAVFERPDQNLQSPLITPISTDPVDADSPDLVAVFTLFHLTWPDSNSTPSS